MSLILSNKPNFYEHNYTSLKVDKRDKGLERIGDVLSMDQGMGAKKIPEGSRRKGRPSSRWLEDVEKEVREMKVKK